MPTWLKPFVGGVLALLLALGLAGCGEADEAVMKGTTDARASDAINKVPKEIQPFILEGARNLSTKSNTDGNFVIYTMKKSVNETGKLSRKLFQEIGYSPTELSVDGGFLFTGKIPSYTVHYSITKSTDYKGETTVNVSYNLKK